MIYKITPMGKPRMTFRDSGKSKMNRIKGMRPCVARYWDFVNQVRLSKVDLRPGAKITFRIPMPKSWSRTKKEQLLGRAHKTNPDLDNLIKALADACYDNDSHLWQYKLLEKVWSLEGEIEINYD